MCLYVLIGLVAPRLALALTWIFRREWLAILTPWWVGLLGFLLLPFTTLAYVLIHAQAGVVDGLGHLIILLAALFLDVGAWGGSRRGKSKKS